MITNRIYEIKTPKINFYAPLTPINTATAVRVSQESSPNFSNTLIQADLDAEAETMWDQTRKVALKAW